MHIEAFVKALKLIPFNSRNVNQDIFATIFRRDETIAFDSITHKSEIKSTNRELHAYS